MNKIMFYGWVAAGALAFGAVSVAQATTLDFTAFPPGSQGTTTLVLPEATVTGFGDDLFVGDTVPNSICSISGVFCEADFRIDFISDVWNLAFDANGYGPGDLVSVTAYNSANASIGTFDITANGAYGFGALSGISWLYFDDSSTAAGLSFANIQFDQASAAVPEPDTLPFMLLGLALVGRAFLRRRRIIRRTHGMIQ